LLIKKFNMNNIKKLKIVLEQKAHWNLLVDFLDTINSIEEFNELIPLLKKSKNSGLINVYTENLIKWKEPKLPYHFKVAFPLLLSRLDNPQKVRIFLRAVDYRNVDIDIMAEIFEEIIYRSENGEEKICFKKFNDSGNQRHKALRTVQHTQLQATSFIHLVLTGLKSYESDVHCGLTFIF